MEHDNWFTRGWTFQELLAPSCIKFFASNWTEIDDINLWDSEKSESAPGRLLSKVCNATGLGKEELVGSPDSLKDVPIWHRMQWAAHRRVTREEVTAYSLMGIFNINMPTGYGEGAEHAFLRLVRAILSVKTACVLEIANWGFGPRYPERLIERVSPSLLIPRSPELYASSAQGEVHFYRPYTPIYLSHLGLCVPVLLMPGVKARPDRASAFFPKGNYSTTASPTEVLRYLDGVDIQGPFKMYSCSTGPAPTVRVFAVINITERATKVVLPETGPCFAIELIPMDDSVDSWEIPEDFKFRRNLTVRPTAFDIVRHNNGSFQISKCDLKEHEMTFICRVAIKNILISSCQQKPQVILGCAYL